MTERSHGRERILNLPGAVSALLAAFLAVHVAVVFGPEWLSEAIFANFAFVPARLTFQFDPNGVLARLAQIDDFARFDQSRLVQQLNTGSTAFVSPLTYAFLHGDWTHLSVNALSLTAFGSPVARRLGAGLFLAFMAAGAVAGALTHFALHPYDLNPVVGASAAISGTMGAIARFAFAPGSIFSENPSSNRNTIPRVTPLSQLSSNRQAILFLTLWLGLNFFLGVFPGAVGVSGVIAWEAHIGGFLCGLLLFERFDRAAHRRLMAQRQGG